MTCFIISSGKDAEDETAKSSERVRQEEEKEVRVAISMGLGGRLSREPHRDLHQHPAASVKRSHLPFFYPPSTLYTYIHNPGQVAVF